MSILLLSIFIALFTMASGFFSASETSLFSLSSMKVRSYATSPSRRKRLIARLVARPRDLLVTILMMNVAVNIMVQNVSSNLFGDISSWTLSVGVPLGLTLVFGEIIPKSLAIQNNTRLAYFVAPVIHTMQRILGPLRTAVVTITTLLSRLVFFWLREDAAVSPRELRHMLETSADKGILSHDETELVDGYLDLLEAQAKELMRPREEILAYDINDPLEDLVATFLDKECTRVPVYDESFKHILGIMSAEQFFINRQAIHRPSKLRPFLSKPFFAPETTPPPSCCGNSVCRLNRWL